MIGGCRKLHNEDLRTLYTLPDITERDQMKYDKMGRACRTYGIDMKNVYKYFVQKIDRKKPLGKTHV
jgi:hypothetical protein